MRLYSGYSLIRMRGGNASICGPGEKKKRSAEFPRIGLAEDKRLQRFLKAYLHGEHLLVICRPLATFGPERRASTVKTERKKKKKKRKRSRGKARERGCDEARRR